jgi:SNF2 family DNA or RNA helicase
MANNVFETGDSVRLKNSPREVGEITQILNLSNGSQLAVVKMAMGTRKFPVSQLEAVPEMAESPIQLVRNGHLPGPSDLRRQISHVRLSGNLADIFYSMENSDTDFYAHQFKPVVKILESPTGNLLIADEVGLGKTIEAGLVWTELAARYKYNRLLVVCPKTLCEKWRQELASRFSIDARICNADELHDVLSNSFVQRSGFAVICGMQSIRPRPIRKRTDRAVDKLAHLLEETQGMERLVDLLVIDEAHHMRNPGTATNKLGQLLCGIAEHVAMLSATPINLHNRDLHSLLRLIDELTFRDESALEQIIKANQPLVAAREAVLSGKPVDEVFQLVLEASRSPILRKATALNRLVGELRMQEDLDNRRRAEIAKRLERVNLLSNVINRTRRRDVEELRVYRDVGAFRVEMTPDERNVYDIVTAAVLSYAWEMDLPTGFLTVMPQRMLASSIPAALMHWHRQSSLDVMEDEEDFIDDEKNPSESVLDPRPLMQVLGRALRDLPTAERMAAQDSKFHEFIRILRERLEQEPSEKFVVFSTFRATLSYLRQRLEHSRISTLMLHGDTQDRSDVVESFRNMPSVSVLLASEVGSEGIDLQFARSMVNYDLPWNPMRVEQRIGRIDRLGQEAPSISVLNLMHSDTVDERIYHRLHERLGLCRKALGGFEDILGRNIASLTKDLLSGKLSDEEEQRRLEQTEQAIANLRKEEEVLERDAAALFAHGDYIVHSINASRREGGWVTEKDIVDYVESSLLFLFHGSTVQWQMEDGLLTVLLSEECRYEFETWCEKNKLSSAPIKRSGGSAVFKVGTSTKRTRHPRLGPTHPFMRFLSRRLEEKDGLQPLAASLRISTEHVHDLIPGIYVGAIEEWEFGKGVTSTVIGNALASLCDGELLSDETADQVASACMSHATHWPTPSEEMDLEVAADCIENVLEPNLAERFISESERREAELGDRVSMQLASLEEHAAQQRQNFERIIDAGGQKLEAANKARLSRFEEGVKMRQRRIEAQAVSAPSSRLMAAYILRVDE